MPGRARALLVDLGAGDRGHLLNDDLFLSECLAPLFDDLEVISSPASIANINNRSRIKTAPLKAYHAFRRVPRLRSILRTIALPCSGCQDVVFQSFDEVAALLFFLLHPKKRLHLIATNSISMERAERHPFLWRVLVRAALGRAASVFVHSRFEVNLIKSVCPRLDPDNIFIKPFHQMAFERARPRWSERSRTVLFMGPPIARKPIEPLIELIKKDVQRRFNYVLRRMEGIEPDARAFLEARPNVDLGFGYLEDDEFYRLFSEAGLVIMTHNRLFEGKLSGPFCDAIASGTPLIARDMSPHSEFFERFGEMGFLVNYDDPQWCERILSTDLGRLYDSFQDNMAACRESCTMENVREVFRVAFDRARHD